MKISECMTREVCIIEADATLREAARAMAEYDLGILPVGKDDRLVGMITDRDIAIQGIAAGLDADARVSEAMNEEVRYCFDHDEIEDVRRNMSDIQVRRMPVLNRDKQLVGIVSIADLATHGDMAETGRALGDIARPSTLHSQSA